MDRDTLTPAQERRIQRMKDRAHEMYLLLWSGMERAKIANKGGDPILSAWVEDVANLREGVEND